VQMFSGFLNAPYVIARRLLIQRNTAADMRGRVSSAFFVSANAFFLVGMAAAGLADVIDVRWLYLFGGLLTVGCGVWGLVLPGIGQPAAEWRKALQLLRTAPAATTKGIGRSVLPSDVDMLVGLIPSLNGLTRQDRERIITQGSVVEVQPGTKLIQAGEAGDDAYFVLQGKAVAGIVEEGGVYHSLSSMVPGDYFGEIAALTGAPRTADVVAEETSQLLHVPSAVLRSMMAQPDFSKMVLSRMSERLARTSIRDMPRTVGITPEDARELRQKPADAKQLEMAIE
jgi:CRP-like cAMP-binding protein